MSLEIFSIRHIQVLLSVVYGYVFIDTVGLLVKLPPSNQFLTVKIEGSIRRGEHRGNLKLSVYLNCAESHFLVSMF